MRAGSRSSWLALTILIILQPAGCGVIDFRREVFAAQPVNSAGEPIYVEDLRAITQDPDLDMDEMADAIRALGIESESLIEAILADGL